MRLPFWLTNVILPVLLISCSGSSFTGSGLSKGASDKPKKLEPTHTNSPGPESSAINKTESFAPKSGDLIMSEPKTTEPEDLSKCWAAVSGGIEFGLPDPYQATSEKDKMVFEGDLPPKVYHQVYGDVVLTPSSTRYEFGKGKKEIDKAIETSFDTVIVTPGLKIELFNASGDLILAKEGPAYIGLKVSENDGPAQSRYYEGIGSPTPSWLLAAVIASPVVEHIIPNTRIVALSKIPGVPCSAK